MFPKLAEILKSRKYSYEISFTYSPYEYCTCRIKRPYFKHLGVRSVASSDEKALDAALKMVERVGELEKKKPIECPPLEKQKLENGCYAERHVDDWHVSFKRVGNTFDIIDVFRKDENGFRIMDEPYRPEKCYHPLTSDEDLARDHLFSPEHNSTWQK